MRIDALGETPSFVFLWSGSGVSLQWGRACLRKWGYRRCEDICWIKSNRETGRNYHWCAQRLGLCPLDCTGPMRWMKSPAIQAGSHSI